MHKIYISFVLMLIVGTVSANEFGRLFTSPEQREQLDELRYQQDVEPIKLNVEIDEKSTRDDTERSPNMSVRVNGLIVREDGKNAAWINNASTFEGDLGMESILVREGDITSEEVQIRLPGNNKIIKLKVGEQYIPGEDDTTDKSFDRNDEASVTE